MLDNTKKLNRPLFPNQVKLGPKTSDIVFTCLKVFRNTIWIISEPWRRPPLCDLKKNDPAEIKNTDDITPWNWKVPVLNRLTLGSNSSPYRGGRGVIFFCSRGVRLNFVLRIFNIFLPHRFFYNLKKKTKKVDHLNPSDYYNTEIVHVNIVQIDINLIWLKWSECVLYTQSTYIRHRLKGRQIQSHKCQFRLARFQ